MPEFSKSRVTRRLAAEADAADVSLSPQAAPVDLRVTPRDSSLMRLAKSLESVNSNLQPFIKAREKEAQEREFFEGMSSRAKMGQVDENAQVEGHNAQDGYWRQKGYLKMSGQLQGFKDAAKMEQLVSSYDLAGMSAEELEGRLQGMTQEFTYGLDEPDFMEGYMDKVESFKNQVRMKHGEAHGQAQVDTIRNATFGNMQQALLDMRGMPAEARATIINQHRAEARAMGIPWQDLDELEFQATVYGAFSTNDASLFESLYQNRPDGTPALARNPKFAAKVLSAQEQLQNKLEQDLKQQKDQIRFKTLSGLDDFLLQAEQSGNPVDLVSLSSELDQHLDNDSISSSDALSVRRNAIETNLKVEQRNRYMTLLRNGMQVPRDKDGDKAFEAVMRGFGSDVERVKFQISQDRLSSDLQDTLNHSWQEGLDKEGNVSPKVGGLIQTAQMFLMGDTGEAFLRRNLDPVAADNFIQAAKMVNAGMPLNEAWKLAQEMNSPTYKELAKDVDWKLVEEKLAKLDTPNMEGDWWQAAGIQDPTARLQIKDLVKAIYPKVMDSERAVEIATEKFLAHNQLTKYGTYIPIINGKALSKEQLESMDNGLQSLAFEHAYKNGLKVDDVKDGMSMMAIPGRPGEVSIAINGQTLPGSYDSRQLALYGASVNAGAITADLITEFKDWMDRAGPEGKVPETYMMSNYDEDARKAEFFAEHGLMSSLPGMWHSKSSYLGNLKRRAQVNETKRKQLLIQDAERKQNERINAARGGMSYNGGNEGFTKDMYAQAIPAAKELGVDPMVLVALSANETGWGRSMVAPHNLFNIKTHSDWNGAYTELNVDEVIDGKTVKEKSRFRSYRSYQESFSDFVAFLNKNPRYSNALAVAKTGDSIGFLKELHKAGYATDPDYSAKVASIFAKLATKTG